MDAVEKLRVLIAEQIRRGVPVQTVWAEAGSVNVQEGTMVATADELEYFDVLLGLGPDITVPEVGSKVLLGIIQNRPEATILLFAERIAQRRINGDVFGGLVQAEVVHGQDAALAAKINALITALASWTLTGAPPVDLASLKAAFSTWTTAPVVVPASGVYQNPKVTHG